MAEQQQSTHNSTNTKEEPVIIKPTILVQLISLGIGLILLIIIGLIGLAISSIYLSFEQIISGLGILASIFAIALFGGVFGGVGNIIMLLVTEYKITSDNEIIITRNFLSKQSQTYRIDQITSVSKKQTLIQKLLNISSVEINIFGLSSLPTQANSNQQTILPILENIKEGNYIFKRITTDMNASEEQTPQFEQQPNTLPSLVLLVVFITLSLLSFISTIITYSPQSPLLSAVFCAVTIILIIISLSISISILKLKKTYYKLYSTSLHINHNYLLSRAEKVVPYPKITNTTNSLNIFSYSIFKLFTIKLYTGGSKDPLLTRIPSTSNLLLLLSYVVKSSQNKLDKSTIQSIIKSKSQPITTLKPGPSFIVPTYIKSVIYLLIFSVLYIVSNQYAPPQTHTFITIAVFIGIGIGILNIIIKLIIKNNYMYEIFEDKIIITGGLVTISSHEIYTKNIKYISYHESFLQRIFNEGSISLYTAGKSGTNGVLKNIKFANSYYKHFETALIYDKNNSLESLNVSSKDS